MLRVKALVTLFSSSLVLAACGQLIGLSDYEEVEDNTSGKGGSSGKGGGSGKGGSSGEAGSAAASGGSAGETGEGGAAAVSGAPAGGTSGDSGTAGESGGDGVGGSVNVGGDGGTSAGADGGGTGGTDGGSGGTGGTDGGSGGQGGGPPRNCTEITPGTVVVAYDSHEVPTITRYYTELDSPLATADLDYMNIEFYDAGSFDGGSVGTFDLGTPEDAQYSSCARCVLIFQDDTSVDGKLYFQESGTLVVQPTSDQMNGAVDVQLQDVTLVEVTIAEGTFISTPVEGGDCVHIEQATLTWQVGSEPMWSCRPSWQGDAFCDCGCLLPDADCSAPTSDVCPPMTCQCPDEMCDPESNWLCATTP